MNIINPYRFGETPSIIPLDNIISEYKFEDNVLDTVGTNDGTPTSLTYADGLVDRTGVYVGSTTSVAIADNNNLSFGNGTTDVPFSTTLLFKYDSLSLFNFYISKSDGTLFEYDVLWSSNDLFFRVFSGGTETNNISLVVPFIPSLDTWYHLTCTYDGSGNISGLTMYINAVDSLVSATENGTYVAMSNTTAPIYLGDYVGALEVFNGNLDCLRFWDKELTQAEVTAIATQELAGIDINP